MSPAAATPEANPVMKFWHGLKPRERGLLSAALAVIAAALLWLTAVRPAWQQVQQAPAKLDELDNQTLVMRRLATEAKELRAAPQVSPTQALAALRASSSRLGSVAKLNVQGEKAVLTVDGITSEALRSWLSEVRSGARARAVEAQLTNGPNGLSGSITLSLAGAN